jgi:hypothetical protein
MDSTQQKAQSFTGDAQLVPWPLYRALITGLDGDFMVISGVTLPGHRGDLDVIVANGITGSIFLLEHKSEPGPFRGNNNNTWLRRSDPNTELWVPFVMRSAHHRNPDQQVRHGATALEHFIRTNAMQIQDAKNPWPLKRQLRVHPVVVLPNGDLQRSTLQRGYIHHYFSYDELLAGIRGYRVGIFNLTRTEIFRLVELIGAETHSA